MYKHTFTSTIFINDDAACYAKTMRWTCVLNLFYQN